MDTTPTTDLAALEAELDAMEAAWSETSARLDALLERPVPVHSISGRLAALQALAAENAAALDAIEAEQAAIAAQLDEMERDD
jgi:hypothetical protein